MSAELVPAETQQHPVATHLLACGVDTVMLIDDAYDPLDAAALQEEIGTLWDRILRSENLKRELATIREGVDDRSQFDQELIDNLFERRDQLPELGRLSADTIFADKLSKLADLEPLKAHFDSIGVRVIEIGSDQPLPDERCNLIFLDYSLGSDDDGAAVATARDRASEIYRSVADDEDKPFIVLMSSKPNADSAKNDFRDRSGLLGGLFAFLKKSEFTNSEQINLHLASWALGMPTRHTIQRFVEALVNAATAASQVFSQRVKSLGVEDYANIQHLSLQADGHPLGDYMLWLYKSLFSHLLHDNEEVLKQQKQLDGLSFEQFTPSQNVPSADLADIYRCALTEPGIGPHGPHPRSAEGNTEPYLQLGDMFFKQAGSPEVLIVLSAACDLAYSPGASRPFPSDQFVLFEYGELQPIEDEPRESAMRTELFRFNDVIYRILWNHRRAVWKEYGAVDTWLAGEGFVRQARLSLPYALELQKSFANHITRIGMPVKPPLFLKADVEVVSADEENVCQILVSIDGGAQVIRRRNKDDTKDEEMFVLTVDCVGKIVASLQRVSEQFDAKLVEADNAISERKKQDATNREREVKILEGRRTGVRTVIEKLGFLMQAYAQWLPLVQKLQVMPAVGQRVDIDSKLLWAFRNAEPEVTGQYRHGPPIVLHLKTTQTAPLAAAVQAVQELNEQEGANDA